MTTFSTRNLFAASCILAAAAPLTSLAQAVPSANDTLEVTEDSSTWLLGGPTNAIDIPAGANGVVINNGLGGNITSQATAIRTEAQTTVNNAGNIFGGFNAVEFVNGLGSGSLTNFASGVISSDSRAVNLGGPAVLTNFGQILGTGNQRNGTVYSDSVANNFSVSNLFGGVIDAGQGNQGSGLALEIAQTTASIFNAGLIQGRTNAPGVSSGSGASGDGLRLANFTPLGNEEVRFFNGDITNALTGVIASESNSGTTAGFRVTDNVGFQGLFDNAGQITGVRNGVYFGNGDHTGGVITSSGVITSGSRALNIDGTGLVVNNAGQILGTGNQRNGTAYADSTAQGFSLNNLTGGVIDAGAGNQGAGFSTELSETGNDFTINNDGDLIGRGNASAGAAIAGDGIRLERTRVGGVLEGSTTGLFTGEINNAGSITSEGANGTVAGFRAVNGVSFQGTLNNAQGGEISGVQNGVYFGNPTPAGGGDHAGGSVNNAGLISSDSRALNIDGTGLVVNNAGQILGTGNQRNGTAYADSTAQGFSLNNLTGGVIDAGAGNQGAGFSTELSETGNHFTINNDGDLIGRGNASAGAAIAGDGIRLERTRVGGVLEGSTTGLFTGEINNAGSIISEGANGTVAGFRAVNGVSFQGTLNNAGEISGVQNGVYFGNPTPAGGGDHTGGLVNNTGLISSDSRAFNLDGNGLVVNNNGDILATGRQRNGTFYADGTADNFVLNNEFAGRIDASGGAGSGVSIQVGSSADDVQNGQINNAGLIAGSGELPVDAGIRLFTNNPGATFEGDINNLFGGTITAGSAPAILVQDGVKFDGDLINNGTIDGAVSFASGESYENEVILGDTSLLVLDVAGLSEGFFEIFDVPTHDLTFGGVLEVNFADAFQPQVGDEIDLFDFNTAEGDFASINAGGVLFDTSLLQSEGVLRVSAVPEPGSLALLALGGVLVARRRRK